MLAFLAPAFLVPAFLVPAFLVPALFAVVFPAEAFFAPRFPARTSDPAVLPAPVEGAALSGVLAGALPFGVCDGVGDLCAGEGMAAYLASRALARLPREACSASRISRSASSWLIWPRRTMNWTRSRALSTANPASPVAAARTSPIADAILAPASWLICCARAVTSATVFARSASCALYFAGKWLLR
ncbi:MAG: hypothetical protein ACRENI_09655 [Gemmatimonadaceae bacterium]